MSSNFPFPAATLIKYLIVSIISVFVSKYPTSEDLRLSPNFLFILYLPTSDSEYLRGLKNKLVRVSYAFSNIKGSPGFTFLYISRTASSFVCDVSLFNVGRIYFSTNSLSMSLKWFRISALDSPSNALISVVDKNFLFLFILISIKLFLLIVMSSHAPI